MVNMGVSVKMVAWFKHSIQPVKGFYPLVRLIFHVMDAGWWRMSDENIQKSTITQPVQHHAGYQGKHPSPHCFL